jgi:hypothetical protein
MPGFIPDLDCFKAIFLMQSSLFHQAFEAASIEHDDDESALNAKNQ